MMRKCLGVYRIFNVDHILDAIVWLFYGKITSVAFFDAFCQAFVIMAHIQNSDGNNIIQTCFIVNVIVLFISFFVFLM